MITWEVYYPKIRHNSRIENMFDFCVEVFSIWMYIISRTSVL